MLHPFILRELIMADYDAKKFHLSKRRNEGDQRCRFAIDANKNTFLAPFPAGVSVYGPASNQASGC
jgi:hypothetical protein